MILLSYSVLVFCMKLWKLRFCHHAVLGLYVCSIIFKYCVSIEKLVIIIVNGSVDVTTAKKIVNGEKDFEMYLATIYDRPAKSWKQVHEPNPASYAMFGLHGFSGIRSDHRLTMTFADGGAPAVQCYAVDLEHIWSLWSIEKLFLNNKINTV